MKTTNLDQLNTAWASMMACVTHDLTTPLLSLEMTTTNLARVFTSFAEGYHLAVKNNLLTPTLSDKHIAAAQNALSAGGIESELAYLLDSLNLLHAYTQKSLPNSPDNKLLDIQHCLIETIKKYSFLDENERLSIDIEITNNFSFSCPLIFIESLFLNLLNNAFHFIRKTNQGRIQITTEETETFFMLYFKDTTGAMSENIAQKILHRFFVKQDGHIIPDIGFCRLALLQRGGDLSCNVIQGQETLFTIKFPKYEK